LVAIATITRLPFIWRGFGGHPDEWRVVRSGLDLWGHGVYSPSRGPGYPLTEVLMSGLAWIGGAPLCAAAAVVASLAALLYLRKLAPLYGVKDWFWPVAAFSFNPWFWSSGTHDLDYVWGTCVVIASLFYLERRRFGWCGLACAFGFAFRPSSLLWVFPIFLRVVWRERRWEPVMRFSVSAAVPALLPAALIAVHSEIVIGGGWQVSQLARASHTPAAAFLLALYRLLELFGNIPTVAIFVIACCANRRKLIALLRTPPDWVVTSLLIFAFLFLVFISQSEKPELMLPALPGLFMILARCLEGYWWKAITAASVFSSFVSFGFGHTTHVGGEDLRLSAPFLRPGPLAWYTERAAAANARVERIGGQLAEPGVIRAEPDAVDLDKYYVAALLRPLLHSEGQIACPLRPALVLFPTNASPLIRPSDGLPQVAPPQYPLLICCRSGSGLILYEMPSSSSTILAGIKNFCRSEPR
jgi:hypothetical protein